MKSGMMAGATLAQRVTATWGERGQAWLQALPAQIAGLVQSLCLESLEPAGQMSQHWVGHGLQQQRPVTLKLGVPDPEFSQETRALMRLQAHPHMVRLYDSSESEGWMLMERLLPGEPLRALSDDAAATEIWLSQLAFVAATDLDHQRFPDLGTWCRDLHRDWPGLPAPQLEAAREMCKRLIDSESDSLVLHGDLHHENLLRSEDGWRVIDPKGLIGGPEFELGAMLRNPFPDWNRDPQLRDRLQLRLERIAADPRFRLERVMDWAYVQAVLAACWSQPDAEASRLWLEVALALQELEA